MTASVLAIDPGLKTGLAWWLDGNQHGSHEVEYRATGKMVENFLTRYPLTQIVCENFFITRETSKKSQSPWSLKLIGVAEYLADLHQIEDVVLQAPADAKRFSTDARLKALGWYKGSAGEYAGHADDASRHLLLYLAKNKLIDLGRIIDQ